MEVVARRGKYQIIFHGTEMSYTWVFVEVKQLYISRGLMIDFDNLKRLSYYPF